MSTCISRHGEYSEHEAGDRCPRCGAFNEEAIVAERDDLRSLHEALTKVCVHQERLAEELSIRSGTPAAFDIPVATVRALLDAHPETGGGAGPVTPLQDEALPPASVPAPPPLTLDRDAVTEALLAWWLDRSAGKVAASPREHCQSMADVVVALARPVPAFDHDALVDLLVKHETWLSTDAGGDQTVRCICGLSELPVDDEYGPSSDAIARQAMGHVVREIYAAGLGRPVHEVKTEALQEALSDEVIDDDTDIHPDHFREFGRALRGDSIGGSS